ncbi:MAG: choice-of-anchor D domain-containing protein [Bacteroidota bacterium]|nr:choice-of-anchor D domain-containing protein [Bacteroidota bacterium]
MIRKIFISVSLLTLLAGGAQAQHWKKIFSVPTVGSAACFYNQDIGCIGTGNYPGGYPAQIFFTTDGGNSWTRSLMPNMNLFGQITDIFYTDQYNGWATLRERIEHGWSGVYKTTDGGKSWNLWYQAEFPVSIRETARGLFFTDRYVGVRRSTDGGFTFQTVAPGYGALGLDFLDDNIGISSSEATTPTYITTNGGLTWNPFDIPHEAWTAYADVATGQLFYSSERDILYPSKESEIAGTANNGGQFTVRFSGPGDAITGAIAGPRWCRSVIFAQGQDSTASNPGVIGFMRSTDGGKNWTRVGGPSNYNDKRFAVTGKGAVVYAFDKSGGVWKTTDGGDGTLTSSSLGRITLTQVASDSLVTATLCDSARYHVELQYSDCDSLIISGVAFLDDTIGELSYSKNGQYFGKDNKLLDTLHILFKPRQVHSAAERIRITIRQHDGFAQDTTILIHIQGLAAQDIPLIAEAGPTAAMDFGGHSICGDDSVRIVTIINAGCAPMPVLSLSASGPPFNLLSSFQPFTLDPGQSRQILLQFKPKTLGPASGTLTLTTASSNTVVSLSGIGKTGERGYKISQPLVTSTICDSTEGDLLFKNISCTPIRLDSIGIDTPFRFDPITLPAFIRNDSAILLHFHFVPHSAGPYTQVITIHSINANDPNDRFDTTLTLGGIATAGIAELVLSASSLDFGTMTTCDFRDEEFTITNTGCDTLRITDELFSGPATGYTILQSAFGAKIARGESKKVIIRFAPSAFGNYSTILHLQTNAGDRDITLTAACSNNPGVLSLEATPVGSILMCKDTVFTLTISNFSCDSLTLDSIIFSGGGSTDYFISPALPVSMPYGKILEVPGKFIPQAGGARNATAHFYLHLADGSVKVISADLDGGGIQPITIQISLPNINLKAQALQKVLLPIQLLDESIIEVSKVRVSVDFNTDLLDPEQFDLSGSVISGAGLEPLLVTKTGISATIDLATPQKLGVGLLGTLVLRAYVTKSLSTPITLTDFEAFNTDSTRDCLPTAIVIPPQIVTSFTLDQQCGDSSMYEYLRTGRSLLEIEHISPNPTSGKITVRLRVPIDYHNDGVMEIFDALGNRIGSENVIATQGADRVEKSISLEGASGLRLIRVRSPEGISSQVVYLVK